MVSRIVTGLERFKGGSKKGHQESFDICKGLLPVQKICDVFGTPLGNTGCLRGIYRRWAVILTAIAGIRANLNAEKGNVLKEF